MLYWLLVKTMGHHEVDISGFEGIVATRILHCHKIWFIIPAQHHHFSHCEGASMLWFQPKSIAVPNWTQIYYICYMIYIMSFELFSDCVKLRIYKWQNAAVRHQHHTSCNLHTESVFQYILYCWLKSPVIFNELRWWQSLTGDTR